MVSSEYQIRVLYAHTDKMGIVSNTRYLEYFEIGRVELLRQLGYPYKEMEDDNIALPVIEVFCKYVSPVYYDELITIKAYLKEKPTVRIKIDYELFSKGKLVTTGYTMHSFLNIKNFKPVRPSQKLLNLLKGKL
ncbi:MAG: thioesterase family protein [Ignavibacteria bacterium]|jgi:acyl-CoA thioester hydrolase